MEKMSQYYNIHDIFSLEITDGPKDAGAYIARELAYFQVGRTSCVNLRVKFVDKIKLPQSYVSLLRDLYYEQGSLYFFSVHGAILVPMEDLLKRKMTIVTENSICPEFLFSFIEKIMMLKFLEKGFCLLHAACYSQAQKTSLYSSLPGTGKTTSILAKCTKGALFLADDLAIVDKNGNVFAYPRAFSLGRHHRKYFNAYLKKMSILKKLNYRLLKLVLFVFKCLSLPVPKLKKRVQRYSDSKDYFRIRIEDIVPGLQILNEAKLDKLIITFKNAGNRYETKTWDKERVTNFLIHNTNRELFKFVSLHFGAFLSYGDDTSLKVEAYLEYLFLEQKKIVCSVVNNCPVKIYHNNLSMDVEK